MTRFTVRKGKHKFHPRLVEFSKKKLKFRMRFNPNCLYNLGDSDQADINKLYGITSLFIHKNSVRFGWRAEEGRIRIFAYWYKRGVRGWYDMGTVGTDEFNDYSIEMQGDTCVLRLNDKKFIIPNIVDWCDFFTFKAFPYFGGNKKAPHSMDIYLYEI